MPYLMEICVAGKTIEVSKYFSVKWHCAGEKREKREGITSEAQKRINQRMAATTLRRLMNTNFVDGDLLVRLDFSKQNFPAGSIEMQDKISKAVRKLRRELKKTGTGLKYIYVKEIGPRGSRHIHMVMNRCDTEILRKCWPHGGIHIDPLISNGQYAKIAEYFIKYALRTEETEGELVGKRWYASRNLERPKIIKKVVSANRFRKKARPLKGYIVDKDSVRSGISELTGYEYYTYTMLKADREGDGG